MPNFTAERTVGPVYLLGLRLSGCNLHSHFLQGRLGIFNRFYQEYYLTVYCSPDLDTEELSSTVVLKSHWGYSTWSSATEGYFKHAQLLWNCVPPSPTWLGAAVDWTSKNSVENALAGATEEDSTAGSGATSSSRTATEDKETKLFKVFEPLTGLIKD